MTDYWPYYKAAVLAFHKSLIESGYRFVPNTSPYLDDDCGCYEKKDVPPMTSSKIFFPFGSAGLSIIMEKGVQMPKYRKKPVVVEAFQFTAQPWDQFPKWAISSKYPIVYGDDQEGEGGYFLAITTLEGAMIAHVGDWIIQGVDGELYPCKPDIFEKTYEKVEE